MMKTTALLILLAAGCGDLDNGITDKKCQQAIDTPDVMIGATETPTLKAGATSVKVRGTAQHALGLAIRRVTVAGLDATSDSFNFSAWSIDVPADVVSILVPGGTTLPATVMLPVVAYDVCNGESPAETGTATVTVEGP